LSHFTPGFAIRAVRVFGRDPPEMATVNLPRFSTDSLWALRMYSAREFERIDASEKE
jgi:hypothetical protein